jgi:branched-chain amino acid transport system substrate-binding protein
MKGLVKNLRGISTLAKVLIIIVIVIVAAVGSGLYISSISKTKRSVTSQISATGQLGNLPPVIIGASLPLTGSFSSFGQADLLAYQYAINQINSQGGIYLSSLGGYAKVQFVYYDDTSNPTTVTSNVQRLITVDNAVALLGGWSTPLIVAEARVAQTAQTAFVGVGSVDPVYDQGNYTWAFIAYPDVTIQSVPILQYLSSLPSSQRPQKMAAWVENSVLGAQSVADWKLQAQKYGFQIVYSTTYESGTKDYSSIILATKQSGAEVVFAVPTPPDGVTMVHQMRDLNYRPALIALPRAAEVDYFGSAGGSAANGVVCAEDWATTLNTTGNKQLVQYFVNKTGHLPAPDFGQAYTAVQILLAAIQKAGSTDKNAIRQALATGVFDTVMGTKSFPKGFGHVSVSVWMIFQWQNGTVQVVWPAAYATAPFIYPRP